MGTHIGAWGVFACIRIACQNEVVLNLQLKTPKNFTSQKRLLSALGGSQWSREASTRCLKSIIKGLFHQAFHFSLLFTFPFFTTLFWRSISTIYWRPAGGQVVPEMGWNGFMRGTGGGIYFKWTLINPIQSFLWRITSPETYYGKWHLGTIYTRIYGT